MKKSLHRMHEFAVCIAFDAFRICLGQEPKNFTLEEIIRWMRTMRRSAP